MQAEEARPPVGLAESIPRHFTAHALDRMSQMGVKKAEVESTLCNPMKVVVSRKYGIPLYIGRRISVPVDTREGIAYVVTVLWPNRETYNHSPRPEHA